MKACSAVTTAAKFTSILSWNCKGGGKKEGRGERHIIQTDFDPPLFKYGAANKQQSKGPIQSNFSEPIQPFYNFDGTRDTRKQKSERRKWAPLMLVDTIFLNPKPRMSHWQNKIMKTLNGRNLYPRLHYSRILTLTLQEKACSDITRLLLCSS